MRRLMFMALCLSAAAVEAQRSRLVGLLGVAAEPAERQVQKHPDRTCVGRFS